MIAWILVGEALGPFQIVGGLIVLLGAYLAQRATASMPVDRRSGSRSRGVSRTT